MFQKISKTIDNLMFSYITFKVVKDKTVYNLKLNFLTIIAGVLVILMMFSFASYSLLIHPFIVDEIEFAKNRYDNQISLMHQYDKSMIEKKKLIKKIRGNFVDAFEISEIEENISESLDGCKNAECIMEMTIVDIRESRVRAIASIPQGMPTTGYICNPGCLFGMRIDPISFRLAPHMGIDIMNALGTHVKATMTGTVVFSGYATYDTLLGGYGNVVVIDNGFYKTLYGHLLYARVRYGQKVKRGEIIAYSGTTGYSTGVHLHYGVIIHDYVDSLEYTK